MVQAPDSTAEAADLEVDVEPGAPPPVVAVVVTHGPGPHLEATLAALRDQEYAAISVLVVDAASEDDPTARVAAVLPSAYVRRLDTDPGYAGAANEVLHVVEGAAFFLFCHDDVALAPDAVRAMIEEAFRSNAGIVAPKIVQWDDPGRILNVGQTADKTGVVAPLVERGELDQEQHDSVRDVFVAPGGCMLVRTDLFKVLEGFDGGIEALGDDLDISWRAQVAGARVVVAPAAVVRHAESAGADLPEREDVSDRELVARHRIRTMLVSYGPWHRLRVVPQAIAFTIAEVVYAVFAGRRDVARDLVGAWRWNLARRQQIRARRRALASIRQLPDSEVRRLQVRGSARVSAFLRGQLGRQSDDQLRSVTSAGRELAASLTQGPLRAGLIVWTALAVVLLFGSRQLIVGKLPPFVDLSALPHRPWTLFSEWLSGWRNAGLGSESPAPTGFAILGSLGIVFLGAMSLLRRCLFLFTLPVGVAGAWRMTRGITSTRARLVGLVTYLAIPLPYNAIARGRWGGLVVWAAAPWLLRLLVRVTESHPFGPHLVSRRRTIVGFGLVLASIGAFVPLVVIAVPVVALTLAGGGLLTGQRGGGGALVGTAFGAAGLALVLHVPWLFDFVLPGRQWSAVGGVQSLSAPLDAPDLLSFHTGPIGGGALGLMFLVVAALPLVIGREWRMLWATRLWILAVACWSVAWVGQQTWFGHALGPPEVWLAPAAAALALNATLGVIAFDEDLPGYRFGLRQGASLVAALALAAGVVPIVGAMFDGRWKSTDESYDSVLSYLHDDQTSVGPFRIAWIGDPDVLPLAGWRLSDGVAYATTDHGLPTVEDRWAGSSDGATSLIADALSLARDRGTSRLGRLFAPMGIRYIVVVGELAPSSGDVRPLPNAVERSLAEQLDLQQVPAGPGLHVYRNVSWAPIRTELDSTEATASTRTPFFEAAAGIDMAGSPPLLTDRTGHATATGHVADDSTVYLAAAASAHWSLTVDGRRAPRSKAFGWANEFGVDRGGNGTLRFNTPLVRYALLAVQIALWVVAIRRLRAWRAEERAP